MKKLAKAGKQKGADDILPWINLCVICVVSLSEENPQVVKE